MRLLQRIVALLALVIFFTSCKPVPVTHWFPVTPQEHYERDLLKEKLEKTQAGQTWFMVSKAVLTDTLFSMAPYRERFYLGDSTPAQSIRIMVPEGRNVVVTPLRNQEDSVSRLFVELYTLRNNGKPKRVEYLKTGEEQITYANHEGDTLLLRMQTGLNEKLTVAISITTQPTLSFPVASHGMQDLISFWGAERDRGARAHEGVDIKARRGTPAVASTDGFITQVGTNNLGGKVVFLSASDSPYSLYYAHLDSQLVATGTRVSRGDTLGLVGNTGNAVTTSPHLHFGVYSRGYGAVNPLPFINDQKEKIPRLPEASKWLGDSVLIRKKVNIFHTSSLQPESKMDALPGNSTVLVIGQMAKGYRVAMPDGRRGYIPTVPFVEIKKQDGVKLTVSD